MIGRVGRKTVQLWHLIKLRLGYDKPPLKIGSPLYRYARRNLAEASKLIHLPHPLNTVLRDEEDVSRAELTLAALRLRYAYDYAKKVWDGYRMFAIAIKVGSRHARIFDAGSGPHSNVLDWLQLYGFKNLYACDILLRHEYRYGHINYYRQDITKTTFPSAFFDFIISQSVIEHGVDCMRFFEECSRLLKPHGLLLISTDFWYQPIDTSGVMLYGRPWRIFTPRDIDLLVTQAKGSGLSLLEPIDIQKPSQVVPVIENQGRRYTFCFFALKKEK